MNALVGRDRELAESRAALAGARAGQPRAVVLRGEAGRTSLARAVAREADAVLWATARRAATRAVAPAAMKAIHRRTEGNPYFVVELVRAPDPNGLLNETNVVAAKIPTGVDVVVAGRPAALRPRARTVPRTGAVVGRTFSLDLVRELTGEGEAEALRAPRPARPTAPGPPSTPCATASPDWAIGLRRPGPQAHPRKPAANVRFRRTTTEEGSNVRRGKPGDQGRVPRFTDRGDRRADRDR